jgi:D-glycero-D-manno-heptose 1,7-bisphosphate phosphatase
VSSKIFFLDRDGTINVDTDYVHTHQEWQFCDGAPEAIRLLNEAGFNVVVATNQSGIIRRRFSLAQVVELHRFVDEKLADFGARIDAWYVAPWHPSLHTGLDPALLKDRKPDTGMFEKALRRFKANPSMCHMAGDKLSDLIPAIQLGMKPHLIKSRFYDGVDMDYVAKNEITTYDTLFEAVRSMNNKDGK